MTNIIYGIVLMYRYYNGNIKDDTIRMINIYDNHIYYGCSSYISLYSFFSSKYSSSFILLNSI